MSGRTSLVLAGVESEEEEDDDDDEGEEEDDNSRGCVSVPGFAGVLGGIFDCFFFLFLGVIRVLEVPSIFLKSVSISWVGSIGESGGDVVGRGVAGGDGVGGGGGSLLLGRGGC